MKLDQIYILNYPSRSAMSQLMRISDFQESQDFKGKTFTWKQCERWWKKKGIDIYDYWDGFNIPVQVFKDFDKKFRYKTAHEQSVCDKFKNVKGKAYVIVILRRDAETIVHELSHAFFYCDRRYRDEALGVLWGFDLSEVKSGLRDRMGYSRQTLQEECISYFIDGASDIKTELKIDIRPYRRLTDQLRKVFMRHVRSMLGKGEKWKPSLLELSRLILSKKLSR